MGQSTKSILLGSYSGFKVGNGHSISLLQFADDTIMAGKGTWDNLWSIKTIFCSFELVSGLKVNFHKSNLVDINLNSQFLEVAFSFLLCSLDAIPFKFLGDSGWCQSEAYKQVEACVGCFEKKIIFLEWASSFYWR